MAQEPVLKTLKRCLKYMVNEIESSSTGLKEVFVRRPEAVSKTELEIQEIESSGRCQC